MRVNGVVFLEESEPQLALAMFSKRNLVDIKKSTAKIQDVKKDLQTRAKHLRIILGRLLFYNKIIDVDFRIKNIGI